MAYPIPKHLSDGFQESREETMNTRGAEADCEFCNGLQGLERDWYDFRILDENNGFVTVAALGSLVPGMVLIVPKRHVPSMALLSSLERKQLYAFEGVISKRLEEIWERPILFEHGSSEEEVRVSACIDHAHWHLTPGRFQLDDPVSDFHQISSFEDVLEMPHRSGYLAFRDQRGWFYSQAPRCSQFFRRLIASELERPSEWDYLVYPGLDNIRETIEKLARPTQFDG